MEVLGVTNLMTTGRAYLRAQADSSGSPWGVLAPLSSSEEV